jgi:PAS domain S-box-containing protein
MGRLFESVRDAVIVADANTGRMVLWNPAAKEIFGYSRAEALGMSVEELVPDYLRARHRRAWPGTATRATGATSTPTRCWTCPPCARPARRSASS